MTVDEADRTVARLACALFQADRVNRALEHPPVRRLPTSGGRAMIAPDMGEAEDAPMKDAMGARRGGALTACWAQPVDPPWRSVIRRRPPARPLGRRLRCSITSGIGTCVPALSRSSSRF